MPLLRATQGIRLRRGEIRLRKKHPGMPLTVIHLPTLAVLSSTCKLPAGARSSWLAAVPFVLTPLPTDGRDTVYMLRLQNASLNKQTTVATMRAVNRRISGKDRLNQMVALIISSRNPDPLGLINSRRKHSSSFPFRVNNVGASFDPHSSLSGPGACRARPPSLLSAVLGACIACLWLFSCKMGDSSSTFFSPRTAYASIRTTSPYLAYALYTPTTNGGDSLICSESSGKARSSWRIGANVSFIYRVRRRRCSGRKPVRRIWKVFQRRNKQLRSLFLSNDFL